VDDTALAFPVHVASSRAQARIHAPKLISYQVGVDRIAERLHLGQPREAVLPAWGYPRGRQ
jgi:hypothetical protein